MRSIFKSLAFAFKKWWLNLMSTSSTSSTKHYLSKELTKEKFLLLEHCLERLNLDYKDLFWFCEDIAVHNQMELCAENRGFSSIKEAFTKEEISAILSAESSLNSAPVNVHEELRIFCHA